MSAVLVPTDPPYPTLVFSTERAPSLTASDLVQVDAEDVMNRLSAEVGMIVDIEWERLGPLPISVELDAMFICEAVNELPRLLEREDAAQNLWLGDGGLVLDVTFQDGLAHITQEHAPFLRRELMTTERYAVPIGRYLGALQQLVLGFLELAKGPTAPAPWTDELVALARAQSVEVIAEPPGPWSRQDVDSAVGVRVPQDLVDLWRRAGEVRLGKQIRLFPTARAVEATAEQRRARPYEVRAVDIVIGELLGAPKLLLLRCGGTDLERGSVVLDPALEGGAWRTVGPDLRTFLRTCIAAGGDVP
jgi:hypothetical protein